MSKIVSEIIADFAGRIRFETLPPAVIHQVKRHLLDTFGCGLAGSDTPAAAVAQKVAGGVGVSKGAKVWWTSLRALPELAAFANATATRALDFNDTYLSKEPAHPSDNVAGVLATAEAMGADGRAFLAALVVAYEIQCRLCDGASLRTRGFDHVTYGLFSSAAAAAKLMGLESPQITQALSIAGVAHIALRQTRAGEISLWKASAFAEASRNGLFAARLAREGMTGPSELFEGTFGFFKLISSSFDADKLFHDGAEFRILQASLKKYPAEYHGQSAVEAGLALFQKKIAVESIDSIEIETFDVAYEIIGKDPEKWRPKTRETADHSLPYLVAVVLADGALTLESFSSERLKDPKLKDLMSRIHIHKRSDFSRAYPETLPTAITVKTKRGERYREEVSEPRGYFKNPMSDEEVESKFYTLAKGRLPKARAKAIVDCIGNLEKLQTMEKLTELLV